MDFNQTTFAIAIKFLRRNGDFFRLINIGGGVMELEELVEAYSDYLFHIAYVYTNDRFAAEEIVQDVYIKFSRTSQFEGRAMIKTYLTRMTINASYDYLRKKKLNPLGLLHLMKSTTKSTEQSVIAAYEQDEIIQAIMQLPLKYREVIFLFYYDDLDVVQIAEALQLSPSTIRTRLQRAREKLRTPLLQANWEVLNDE